MDCTITNDGSVWITKGENENVNPGLIEPIYNKSLQGSFSYHNHPPRVTNYSFSADDIAFFVEKQSQFFVSSDDIFQYYISRTEDTPKMDYDVIASEFIHIYKTTVMNKSFNKEIDMDFDGYHEAVKILSDKYKFIYLRREL